MSARPLQLFTLMLETLYNQISYGTTTRQLLTTQPSRTGLY